MVRPGDVASTARKGHEWGIIRTIMNIRNG
jgi:hypothetical protein